MPDLLDIEQPDLLIGYLRDARRIGPQETPRVSVLAGGVSNRTVLVERESGEAWVLKQALHKLRTPVDWYSDPARIDREAMGLRWLAELAPPGTIPALVFEDPAHHLLGMQAVPKPHENWKSVLMAGRVEEDHVRQFGELLAAVHLNAARRADDLATVFDDRTYFESLRLEPYYAYTASVVPQAAGFYDELIADTRANRWTVVHGDYSPKNVLVTEQGSGHAGRLVLLDHEVIHWGDPAFDLGFGLTHLLSKAHHLAAHCDRFRRAALRFGAAYWGGLTDDDIWIVAGLQERWVRHTLGCLLARVDGRSPLEYLTADQRVRQREVVLRLMADPPAEVPTLIERFISAL